MLYGLWQDIDGWPSIYKDAVKLLFFDVSSHEQRTIAGFGTQ